MDKIITRLKPVRKPNPHWDSGINYDEIWEFYPNFFEICSKLNKGSDSQTKKWVSDVLDFLNDWDSLTWPQFASIYSCAEPSKFKNWYKLDNNDVLIKYPEYLLITNRDNVLRTNPKNKSTYYWIPKTDKDKDELYKQVYKQNPRFWQVENQNMSVQYDLVGNRIFVKDNLHEMSPITKKTVCSMYPDSKYIKVKYKFSLK